MKITVIGSGNIGGGLVRAWRRAGHDVTIGARNPSDPELRALCAETGATADEVGRSVRDAEVVVLATPWRALDDVFQATGPLEGRIVIDCTNAIGPGFTLLYGHTTSSAEEVQKRLPAAKVVRAYNAQGAENLAAPEYGGVRATNFHCGDDPAAKAVVRRLVEEVGFDAVDAGPLRSSRLLEPLMLLWVTTAQSLGSRDLAFRLLRR